MYCTVQDESSQIHTQCCVTSIHYVTLHIHLDQATSSDLIIQESKWIYKEMLLILAYPDL